MNGWSLVRGLDCSMPYCEGQHSSEQGWISLIMISKTCYNIYIMAERDPFQPPVLPERNPQTHKAHNREVFYQITLPMVFGIVTALLLAVLATQATASKVSTWADISLIMMVIPTMIVSVLFLVLTAGTIYLMVKLLPLVPPYARFAQDWFAYISFRVRMGADKSVEPFLRVNSYIASVRAFRRNLRG